MENIIALVIGLGSMGKRRVRCLKALGVKNIFGYDTRRDRIDEARGKYGIQIVEDPFGTQSIGAEVCFISTSPEKHMDYAEVMFTKGVHCFIEASVVEPERVDKLDKDSKNTDVLILPSATLLYSRIFKEIHKLLDRKAIGKILNINYQRGQYLPDWHLFEDIQDFYVSKRETGGAREIVSFEMVWLNYFFGTPKPLSCVKQKLTDINADIDDIYHCVLAYPQNILCNMTIDVISRPEATRELRILGSKGVIAYAAETDTVRHKKVGDDLWTVTPLQMGYVEEGYISPEDQYIEEVRDFLMAAQTKDRNKFPNDLGKDAHILKTLYALDKLSERNGLEINDL
jgi:predicted dehydrogenase